MRTGTVVPPAKVEGVDDVVAVADGALNVLALHSHGGVTGWGVNLTQIPGDEDGTRVREISDAPGSVAVTNPGGAAVVATGAGEVCAWGNNSNGLLGVEPRGEQSSRPVRVADLEDVTDVAGGNDHALALDTAGRVWVWGNSRRVAPYETPDLLPRVIALPGPAQEVSGNVVLLGPRS